MRIRYTPAMLGLALGLAALAPIGAHAQNATRDAVDIATTHFRQRAASFATTGADLADLAPTDAYTDAVTGTSYVYLRQRVNGIEVYNTPAVAAVTRNGEVYGASAQFRANLAARANDATPTIGATDAMRMAATQLGILDMGPVVLVQERTDLPGGAVYRAGTQETTAHLVYFATEAGAVRLGWEFTLPQRIAASVVDDGVYVAGREHLWALVVDATTGRILNQADLSANDTWAPPPSGPRSYAPLMEAHVATVPASASAMAGSYRVFPLPAESPNHGTSALVANPSNATASPNGWHTAGANSYTVTRGNNTNAYLDRDGNGAADANGQPDGGGGLVFDFAHVPGATPFANRNAAVTSLFYWNNIVHDVLWHYGFNDVAGNFQMVNAGGGSGNDPVLAEAQDNVDPPASATTRDYNNANFSSPADGLSGRMQMFEWYDFPELSITAPTPVPNITAGAALWGGRDMTISSLIVLPRGVEGDVTQACNTDPIANTAQVAGKVVLIERGNCNFTEKARNAQAAGAAGVIIYNCLITQAFCAASANPGEAVISMALTPGQPDDISIPGAFVANSVGVSMTASVPNTAVTLVASQQNRDSDMDAGVIMHEFGHGVSNRLIGGPTVTGCVSNTEQAGEGWSDFIGVLITMRPGDTGATHRGVGTYLNFEPTTGEGIRNAPYSTDFAVNDYTYQDLISFAGTTGNPRSLTIPHGVGFVWATMLWEMTWELIATNGWSPDVYNATGNAGNQIAMRLVIEGLKLTPCGPGFVQGRDAIIAADVALYGGSHRNQIWRAFARRGLGQNATQGSPGSVNDGTADFTVPVANEPGTTATSAVVTAPAPNPVAGRAELSVSLVQPEAVRVEVFDALGRLVTLAHDGEMGTGSRTVALDLADVAPGVYVWRVSGESFSQSGRITVVH